MYSDNSGNESSDGDFEIDYSEQFARPSKSLLTDPKRFPHGNSSQAAQQIAPMKWGRSNFGDIFAGGINNASDPYAFEVNLEPQGKFAY